MLKEKEGLYFLRQFSNENTAISFSGGKDSLVVAHLASRAGIERAVFCDTTLEANDVIEFVKEIENTLGIKIDIVKPRVSFWELIQHLGVPSLHNRWCCPILKFQPLDEYARKHGIKYYVTGLRKAESSIRSGYKKVDRNPMLPNVIQLNPIINWSVKDVWRYIKKYNLPEPPQYRNGLKRSGCLICPYKSPKELEVVKRLYPEVWNRFQEFLEYYAQLVQIPDKQKFRSGRWRLFRAPVKKSIVGTIRLNERGEIEVSELTQQITQQSFRLLKILHNSSDKDKLKMAKILVEKELNCLKCGACLSLCSSGALFLDDNGINVDIEKCSHCYECLKSSKLRMSCIARNYRLNKKHLEVFA